MGFFDSLVKSEGHMGEDPIPRIRKWLEEQGYPLEMKVARLFQEAGFSVSSAEYYVDPEEGKPREIDVIASMATTISGVSFQLAYTVECKSSKKSPWVCFRAGRKQQREPSIGFLARHATAQGRDLLTELSCNPDVTTGRLFHLPDDYAYGIANVREKGVDLPYQAILGARKAAQSLIAHYDQIQKLPNAVHTVCIAFPLIVVDTLLFNCELGNTGDTEITETSSQTVLRTGFDTYYSIVEIAASSALKEFIESRAAVMANFLRRLEGRIPATLQQLEIANVVSEPT
jgi:hypothetical protein